MPPAESETGAGSSFGMGALQRLLTPSNVDTDFALAAPEAGGTSPKLLVSPVIGWSRYCGSRRSNVDPLPPFIPLSPRVYLLWLNHFTLPGFLLLISLRQLRVQDVVVHLQREYILFLEQHIHLRHGIGDQLTAGPHCEWCIACLRTRQIHTCCFTSISHMRMSPSRPTRFEHCHSGWRPAIPIPYTLYLEGHAPARVLGEGSILASDTMHGPDLCRWQ